MLKYWEPRYSDAFDNIPQWPEILQFNYTSINTSALSLAVGSQDGK